MKSIWLWLACLGGLPSLPLAALSLERLTQNVMAPRPVPVVTLADLPPVETSRDLFLRPDILKPQKHIVLSIPGFIFAAKQRALGIVAGGVEGETFRESSGELMLEIYENIWPQQTYSIIRYREAIQQGLNQIGFLYTFIGQIQVQHVLRSGQAAVANVLSFTESIRKGDMVVPYRIASRVIPVQSEQGSTPIRDGSIVAFGEEGSRLASVGDFIFFDRGAQNGVRSGQTVNIYRGIEGMVQKNDTLSPDYRQMIGQGQVVDVTATTACARVMTVRNEVQLSDWVAGQ